MFEALPPRRLMSVVPLLADCNDDGRVNAVDFGIVATNFGRAGAHSAGDATGDGTINSQDFDQLAVEFGKSSQQRLIFRDEFTGSTVSPTWTKSQYWWPD